MHTATADRFARIKILTAGVVSLILLMGVARFSYTPLLPLMQQQTSLSISQGAWLASINYLGYFTGVLITASISNMMLKDTLYRLGIIVAIASTAGMALSENIWLWAGMRYLAGLSTTAGMLLSSGLILNWLIRNNYRSELGIHFAGAGLGIALCGYMISVLTPLFDWREQWFALSILGIALAIPAWRWLPRPTDSHMMKSGEALIDRPPSPLYLRLFMAAYFCAGVGYVVSATFIVAIIDQQNPASNNGSMVFIALGLAAAPSCIAWDLIARKTGDLYALMLACSLQTVGIILPVLHNSTAAAYIGAILFGGTFMGVVSLVLTNAGKLYPAHPSKMMGKMTISYGIAQIAAPAITGYIASLSGDYRDGLIMAAIVMAIGTILIACLIYVEKKNSCNASPY